MRAEQINVEHFFRLLYDLFFSGNGTLDLGGLRALASEVWFWIVVVGYTVSVIGLFVIIYVSLRLFELRKREEEYYSTVIETSRTGADLSPRWQHIQALIESGAPSQWREAITEADILLEDLLKQRGYNGEGVGDRLKSVDENDLASLNEAWEAHKVRNAIAHQGSAFDLSESLAQRTIQRYEAVFREWGAI